MQQLTRRVVVQEDPRVYEQVQEAAHERGTTPSAYIREAVRLRLQEQKDAA